MKRKEKNFKHNTINVYYILSCVIWKIINRYKSHGLLLIIIVGPGWTYNVLELRCGFTLKTQPTYLFPLLPWALCGWSKIIDNEHISFILEKEKPFCVAV